MKILLLSFLVVAISAGMYIGNNLWLNSEVPDQVKVRFVELYPTAKNPVWNTSGDQIKSSFRVSGRERSALFRTDGKLMSYTEEIEKRHLPAPILLQLQEKFAGFEIVDTHRFHVNDSLSYLIELNDNDAALLLRMDRKGVLLNQKVKNLKVNSELKKTATARSSSAINEIRLGTPEGKWNLPGELREVSGIAMLPDGSMACVQDEQGIIFIYDLTRGGVVEKINFSGPGDYEGLALAGNTMYVLRSDGALFEIKNYSAAKPAVTLYEFKLAKTQNAEGLAYDEANNRLLIACKGYDKNLKDAKGIYAFSVAEKVMYEAPSITIPMLQKALTQGAKRKKDPYDYLQPSSLEIHPLTGELYMLDARNHLLLVVDKQGQVQKLVRLSKKEFRQAEAICFGSNGEMFIASEGAKKGTAKLVKYGKGI